MFKVSENLCLLLERIDLTLNDDLRIIMMLSLCKPVRRNHSIINPKMNGIFKIDLSKYYTGGRKG